MHIGNEPDRTEGVLAQLFKLQTEFSARLTEETIKYLRRLQGMAAPAAPETVVVPTDGTVAEASAAPGGIATIELHAENRQRVHTVVSASLSAVVAPSGVTWFPQPEVDPAMLVIAPGETRPLSIAIPIPAGVPEGAYRGAVLMPGFRDEGLPVLIDVVTPSPKRPKASATTSSKKSKGSAATATKPAAKKKSTAGTKTAQKKAAPSSKKRTAAKGEE